VGTRGDADIFIRDITSGELGNDLSVTLDVSRKPDGWIETGSPPAEVDAVSTGHAVEGRSRPGLRLGSVPKNYGNE
jgi:hypothetical protein